MPTHLAFESRLLLLLLSNSDVVVKLEEELRWQGCFSFF